MKIIKKRLLIFSLVFIFFGVFVYAQQVNQNGTSTQDIIDKTVNGQEQIGQKMSEGDPDGVNSLFKIYQITNDRMNNLMTIWSHIIAILTLIVAVVSVITGIKYIEVNKKADEMIKKSEIAEENMKLILSRLNEKMKELEEKEPSSPEVEKLRNEIRSLRDKYFEQKGIAFSSSSVSSSTTTSFATTTKSTTPPESAKSYDPSRPYNELK